MLIGYDGIGVNFGNNKTAYIGKAETTIRYGNHALKVDETGVKKLDPNSSGSWVNLNSLKIYTMTSDYTLEDDVDMVLLSANGANRTLTLPSNAVKGRMVYVKDRGNNASISVKCAGTNRMMAANAYNPTDTIAVNNVAEFFVYDGYYWLQFYCG